MKPSSCRQQLWMKFTAGKITHLAKFSIRKNPTTTAAVAKPFCSAISIPRVRQLVLRQVDAGAYHSRDGGGSANCVRAPPETVHDNRRTSTFNKPCRCRPMAGSITRLASEIRGCAPHFPVV